MEALSSCSPCSCVRAGDLEADLFNDPAHDFIIGLDRRMNHQLNLHSSKQSTSPFPPCVRVCVWGGGLTHLLGDPVLDDSGAVELQQTFSGQAVNQACDGLLAAL